jgi:hypothetical protein
MIFLLSLLYNQFPIPTKEKSLPSQVTANKNPYHFKERKRSHLTNSKALVASKDDDKYLLNSGSLTCMWDFCFRKEDVVTNTRTKMRCFVRFGYWNMLLGEPRQLLLKAWNELECLLCFDLLINIISWYPIWMEFQKCLLIGFNLKKELVVSSS